MDQDTKNQGGAPSSDTTSALFVSARKKQLEQQEAERRAKEKEEQRLAAEAEVRRLEREVEERKRKTEEEARLAEEDARRVAQEARAKKAEAAANPDAVLGSGKEKSQGVRMPGVKLPGGAQPGGASVKPAGDGHAPDSSKTQGTATAKAPMNKKLVFIISGAAAAVLVLAIILFAVGGKGASETEEVSAEIEPGAIITMEDIGGAPAGMKRFSDDEMGIAFNYPSKWIAEFYKAGGGNADYDFVMTAPEEDGDPLIMIANYSNQYNSYINGGGTDGTALVEALIGDAGLLGHYKVSDLSDLEYLPMRENADGSIEFDATWTFPNGAVGYAAIAVYEDRQVASASVVIRTGEDEIDYINSVLMSTEVW